MWGLIQLSQQSKVGYNLPSQGIYVSEIKYKGEKNQ